MTTVDKFQFEDIHYFRFGYSPFGKPTMYVYFYFVDGLLIDAGQRKARSKILKELSPLPVQQLFITHHHEDHTGNIHELQQEFECPVYATELCCKMMKDPPSISFAQWLVWGNRPAYETLTPIESMIKIPNHQFQLIPIPGHAEDMVALYEPERKWLFSADLYINSYIGYYLKNESIISQINSLKRALKLDFNQLFCSHSPQLIGGKEKLREKLNYLEAFYENVTKWYRQGLNAKEIYKRMNLKEHGYIHLLSHGKLSKLNMVKSAIRDYEFSQISEP